MPRLHRFKILTAWYAEHMTINSYRPRTISDYSFEISFFHRWLEEHTDLEDIDDLAPQHLHDYAATLYARGLQPRSIGHKLAVVRAFLICLYTHNKLYVDLGHHISLPQTPRRLPKNILSEKEMTRVFAYLERTTRSVVVRKRIEAVVVRDHALMEVLYSTGIRKAELLGLTLDDINYADGLVHVRGKGGKHRMVPIGRVSLGVVRRYVCDARPLLAVGDCTTLFVSLRGRPMCELAVLDSVKRIVARAGISRKVNVHGIRHCSATHMLNRGADIRYVQELLGHASVSTTQIYTHISIRKLKQTHARCHPREQMEFEE